MKKLIFIISFLLFSTHIVNAQKTKFVAKYSNDSIEQVGYFNSNHQKDSLWLWYSPEGTLIGEMFFVNGKKNGLMKTFNDKGIKIFEIEYENDIKIKGKQYDSAGNLIDTRDYVVN